MFVPRARAAGPRPLQLFVRIMVKLDPAAADAPNDAPAVVARKLALISIAHCVEEFQLDRMRDKVLRPARQ